MSAVAETLRLLVHYSFLTVTSINYCKCSHYRNSLVHCFKTLMYCLVHTAVSTTAYILQQVVKAAPVLVQTCSALGCPLLCFALEGDNLDPTAFCHLHSGVSIYVHSCHQYSL
jgi:hypothetical protein